MLDVSSLLAAGITDFTVTMKYSDLVAFGDHIIERVMNAIIPVAEDNAQERTYTKQEVMEKFGVCASTLWHWERSKTLVPVRIGRKVTYRFSDVSALINRKISK